MQVSSVLASLIGAYVIFNILRFLQSYQTARKIGLPICICPVDLFSLPWRIFSVPLRPVFKRYLPEWLSFRLEMGTYGGEFVLGQRVVQKYGSAVTLCGIGSIQILSADAQMSSSLLQKPRDYPPAPISQKIMRMCGPNLISTTGDQWQRQRRVIAPMINERISGATWVECIRQANSMMEVYTKAGNEGATSTSMQGMRQLAFNVLGSVAYGKPQDWEDPLKQSTDSKSDSTFLDILLLLTENLVIAALLPTKLLLSPIMPAFVRQTGEALVDFPKRTMNLIAENRQSGSTANNLMSTIVKFADEANDKSKLYLTQDEITGNLFSFTLAGYDTTANTMTYAITILAAHPEWQEWLWEEVDQVAKDGEEYELVFPRLKRVHALMLETLRLYTPVLHIVRNNASSTVIKTDTGTGHVVPPNTEFQLSLTLLHINPKYWGDDAAEFKPSRWIKEDGNLMEPAKGTFMPWSLGPRMCPGIKMSQVEFVSTFYTILRKCKVSLVLLDKESLEEAQRRIHNLMMDSQPIITLQMNQPSQVHLRWLPRV